MLIANCPDLPDEMLFSQLPVVGCHAATIHGVRAVAMLVDQVSHQSGKILNCTKDGRIRQR